MKKYILIAGVNGAGKSTLYQALESLKDMPRINTEIFNRFAIYQGGKLFDLANNRPDWYKKLKI